MSKAIEDYNTSQSPTDKTICDLLRDEIDKGLTNATSKIWHAHPVWFLDGNPIVGYSKLKDGVRLMFWSGAGFDEDALKHGTGKFRDASVTFTDRLEIDTAALHRWLKKAKEIQWDYKNIVKRKGVLVRIPLTS